MDTPIEQGSNTLMLSSSAFEPGGTIPSKYTCDGENLSPPLSISGVPNNTESLVLIAEDPDVPKEVRDDQMFDHWLVFNIPNDTRELGEGATPVGTLGVATSSKLGYTGPCPPTEYEPCEHRYFFRIYALDTTLPLREGSTKEEVVDAMEGHILDSAEVMGRYAR